VYIYFANPLKSSTVHLFLCLLVLALTNNSRSFSPSAVVRDDDLPYHIVVGMPALSPTMETGVLTEWYKGQGDGFSAGEVIAKIETDKASIDFEAQDDGVIAKILLDASGDDIPVGTPIMVTVEEPEDVDVFADFVAEAAAEPEPTPEPVVEAPKVQATPPPPPAAAPAPVAAAPEAVAASPPAMDELVAAVAPVMSTGWGGFAKINSPIAKTLSKQQSDYVKKYGTAGQVPL
jgi:pyruvate dehydrogenase E2 component (dihydrolipoamide acetyltransferase)